VHACCSAAQQRLATLEITEQVTAGELHDLVDLVEVDINEIHQSLAVTYFGYAAVPVQRQIQESA
jgi:hypothetical protein